MYLCNLALWMAIFALPRSSASEVFGGCIVGPVVRTNLGVVKSSKLCLI